MIGAELINGTVLIWKFKDFCKVTEQGIRQKASAHLRLLFSDFGAACAETVAAEVWPAVSKPGGPLYCRS